MTLRLSQCGNSISVRKTEVQHQPWMTTDHARTPSLCTEKHWNRSRRSAISEVFLHRMLRSTTKTQNASVRLFLPMAGWKNRVWSNHGVWLSTKVQVYRTVVLSTLFYGCETWTQYRRHIKMLEQFHQHCLRKIFSSASASACSGSAGV